MEIIVDEELKDCVTEDWIKKILSVVPSEMLENLIVRIAEPTKYWKPLSERDLIENWDRQDVQRELSKRLTMGASPKPKEVEVKVVKKAWLYYRCRRDVARVLYHEVYHANDLNGLDEGKRVRLSMEEYENHPREVRARAFERKMFQCLKGKRKLFKLKQSSES